MADEIQSRQPRGDEAQLFREYNDELLRTVRRAVDTSPEVVEDACAFAWAKFLRNQPDRDRNWRGWLFRVAQREAWVLDRARRETVHFRGAVQDDADRGVPEPADPRDVVDTWEDLDDALSLLSRLPIRQQRLVMLRALGLRYSDIGEVTGDSYTRVNALLVRADRRIRSEMARQETERRNPIERLDRLERLEAEPPSWLVSRIGRPPRLGGHSVAELLAWRAAALAIDDYRREHKPDLPAGGTEHRPASVVAQRAWALTATTIRRLELLRGSEQRLEHER
jgi:RNA polymerase sigma factor (sigma-70 family)